MVKGIQMTKITVEQLRREYYLGLFKAKTKLPKHKKKKKKKKSR